MYYKTIKNGYVTMIGMGTYISGEEVTQEEYDNLVNIIKNRPSAEDGYGYRLTEGLEWEQYELPVQEVPNPQELTAEEALEIIVGGEL